ncbi:DUF3168 domain-containing protein [Pseudovibrio sp. SPO723]|uniref:DUF3168 domain-containing protein n=1 Tax=Nesiotobacter zosterae TaxID=392721 RepID=UPI0029C232EB|nr:DUF3168 domain-containing protein [Pseudovibrio sp. SPO723]MDX5595586.1 DUF3168 domain-containing protein [Pseudovibrio sp. SPO723]
MSQHSFREAVVTALRSDAQLVSLLGGSAGRIVDGAPAHIRMPYVALSRIETESLTGHAQEGERLRFTINIYSRELTRTEAASIADRIKAFLTTGPLTTDSGARCLIFGIGEAIAVLRDRRTWRAELTGRAIVEPEDPQN